MTYKGSDIPVLLGGVLPGHNISVSVGYDVRGMIACEKMME